MVDSVSRFNGFAATYDRARPRPPADLVDLLTQWSGVAEPDVLDIGAGTGLSTVVWAGRAQHALALEPGEDMRAIAKQRFAELSASPTVFKVINATAEQTGLPDECVDIVTASQAMHWFDPAELLPEVARLLRPGGVFAAYDVDWPPAIDEAVDAAYNEVNRRIAALPRETEDETRRWGKAGHLARMVESGLFSYAREICLHSRDTGGPERLVDLMRSQSGIAAVLTKGHTEDEIGLTALREIATARMTESTTWWWTYRIRVAAK
ncbi:MAG TPA: class I SAM-dependent methyltransferase [Pseudonocardiaceae bacterium]|jgi:ubiquinone/menaquinone biosynthesis C-methylase UbiE|nr:class I SAM-dependent methyltransferase [Pseudonocardiaceae bacterium]